MNVGIKVRAKKGIWKEEGKTAAWQQVMTHISANSDF